MPLLCQQYALREADGSISERIDGIPSYSPHDIRKYALETFIRAHQKPINTTDKGLSPLLRVSAQRHLISSGASWRFVEPCQESEPVPWSELDLDVSWNSTLWTDPVFDSEDTLCELGSTVGSKQSWGLNGSHTMYPAKTSVAGLFPGGYKKRQMVPPAPEDRAEYSEIGEFRSHLSTSQELSKCYRIRTDRTGAQGGKGEEQNKPSHLNTDRNHRKMERAASPEGAPSFSKDNLFFDAAEASSGFQWPLHRSEDLDLVKEPLLIGIGSVYHGISKSNQECTSKLQPLPYFSGCRMNRSEHIKHLERAAMMDNMETSDSGISLESWPSAIPSETRNINTSSRFRAKNKESSNTISESAPSLVLDDELEVGINDCKAMRPAMSKQGLFNREILSFGEPSRQLPRVPFGDANAGYEHSDGHIHSWLSLCMEENDDTSFLKTIGDESDDEDTYEVSESSGESWDLDETHPYYAMKLNIIQQCLLEYRQRKRPVHGHGNEANQAQNTDVRKSQQSHLGSSTSRLKRSRRAQHGAVGGDVGGGSDDEDADDNDGQPPRKMLKGLDKLATPGVQLACPFAKRHPRQYRRCYAYTINRIQDVKQHLSRNHRMPLYCRRCGATFKSDHEYNEHARSVVICPLRQFTIPEGMTEAQAQSLRKRVHPKSSVEDQWFEIFTRLFPDDPLPASPFVAAGLTEELRGFMDFMLLRGPTLVNDRIEGLGDHVLPGNEDSVKSLLKKSIMEGLVQLADDWICSHTESTPPSLTGTESTSGTSEPQLPLGMTPRDLLPNPHSIRSPEGHCLDNSVACSAQKQPDAPGGGSVAASSTEAGHGNDMHRLLDDCTI